MTFLISAFCHILLFILLFSVSVTDVKTLTIPPKYSHMIIVTAIVKTTAECIENVLRPGNVLQSADALQYENVLRSVDALQYGNALQYENVLQSIDVLHYENVMDCLLRHLGGMVVLGTVLFLFRLATCGNGIGGGDVRLMCGVGMFLGVWPGLEALLIGSVCFCVYFAVSDSVEKETGKACGFLRRQFPFGPFLAFGTVIVDLWTIFVR